MTEPTPTPIKNGDAFHAADQKTVGDVYDEYVGKPTSAVKREHRDVQNKRKRARSLLGDDMENIDSLVESKEYGSTPQECWLKLAELNALDGGLRKVITEHTNLTADHDAVIGTPGARAPEPQGIPGFAPRLESNPFRDFKTMAQKEGVDLRRSSFNYTFDSDNPADNPILNTLFETVASNPEQVRTGGAFSTLREAPSSLLSAVPKRGVVGVQTEVKELLKTVDTQAAGPRREGGQPRESTYRWEEFQWRVRDIAAFIRATDESFDDHPGMEDRVITDLMGELDIELLRQMCVGSGVAEANAASDVDSASNAAGGGTPLIGLANAGATFGTGSADPGLIQSRENRGTFGGSYSQARNAASAAREHAAGTFLNARFIQATAYNSGSYAPEAIFDDILDGITLIENSEILMNRMATHLVLEPAMITAMNKSRYAKAGTSSSEVREAEYVLGGPLAPRFGFMPWGLSLIPQTYSIGRNGTLNSDRLVGFIISNNRRNWEMAFRSQAEMRRGYVNTQLIEWSSTIAARLRVALCVYDPAAFCVLAGS